ncbi:hypothetical protein [Accumulibacter sp.]|uniref:hypothetical protein n=1 Tax=Accumulibacter sp. TaxID=2053492 RepID=UPI0025FCBA44|nr:hypothetical protein [Accumulibacter sp.]MCM8594191.1 hypothetical protein [Accumulibacter sp.]MCM8625753.1 hypothetical protein [Accumulibacter sp.]MDS4048334.1 hypothetical protein [Accumulibacter sp.]
MAPGVVTWALDLRSIREYVAVLPAAGPEPEPDIVKLESFRDDAVALVRDGDTALEGGRIDQALSAARAGVQRFRQRRAALGDPPQALRDLSVSLERLLAINVALGRAADADVEKELSEVRGRLSTAAANLPAE